MSNSKRGRDTESQITVKMECQTRAYSINTLPHAVLLSNTSLISFVFTPLLQADRPLSGCTYFSPIRVRNKAWNTSVSHRVNLSSNLQNDLPCGAADSRPLSIYTYRIRQICVCESRVITTKSLKRQSDVQCITGSRLKPKP